MRTVAVLLAGLLLLGTAPQGAYAQVARVAVGETGSMPVTPIGNSAVLTGMTPALNLGAASLNGSFAPAIAPAPAGFTPVAAPVAVTAALNASPSAAATPDKKFIQYFVVAVA